MSCSNKTKTKHIIIETTNNRKSKKPAKNPPPPKKKNKQEKDETAQPPTKNSYEKSGNQSPFAINRLRFLPIIARSPGDLSHSRSMKFNSFLFCQNDIIVACRAFNCILITRRGAQLALTNADVCRGSGIGLTVSTLDVRSRTLDHACSIKYLCVLGLPPPPPPPP